MSSLDDVSGEIDKLLEALRVAQADYQRYFDIDDYEHEHQKYIRKWLSEEPGTIGGIIALYLYDNSYFDSTIDTIKRNW